MKGFEVIELPAGRGWPVTDLERGTVYLLMLALASQKYYTGAEVWAADWLHNKGKLICFDRLIVDFTANHIKNDGPVFRSPGYSGKLLLVNRVGRLFVQATLIAYRNQKAFLSNNLLVRFESGPWHFDKRS